MFWLWFFLWFAGMVGFGVCFGRFISTPGPAGWYWFPPALVSIAITLILTTWWVFTV